MFHYRKCDGCNRDLSMGSPKFNVRIEVTSDFDGFLPEDTSEGDMSDRFRELFEQIEALTSDELEAEVQVEYEMCLCPECRHRFVEELESYTEGGLMPRAKQPINLH